MKVLMTGATGFIGRHVAARLRAGGNSVIGLTRSPDRASKMFPEIEFHPWDPGKLVPPELVGAADAVVNLAGESVNGRWTDQKKARIMDSRVEITSAIVAAMSASRSAPTLVSASAVGVYGDRGDFELTELSPPGEGFLKEVVTRWEAEAWGAERLGSRVAILRLGIVLGRDGGAMEKLLPLARLGINGRLGSGEQWWPWVHIDDVAAAFEAALVQEMRGVFNVTSPEPVQQKRFASVLGKVIGRPSFMPAPAFAVRLVRGEFADEVLFSKRVRPQALLESGFAFRYPELEEALNHLTGKERELENLPAHA